MHALQAKLITLPEWYHLLQDTDALLQEPTKHHRELLHQAYWAAAEVDSKVKGGTFPEHAGTEFVPVRSALFRCCRNVFCYVTTCIY